MTRPSVLDEIIHELSRSLAQSAPSASMRQAARLTGGVPVYEDLGGVLVLLGQSRVVQFDPDTKAVQPIDGKWKAFAMFRAAASFRELACLAPLRPSNATTCSTCGGSGTVHAAYCGACGGLGWQAP